MFKILFTAVILAASLCAKAQEIKIFSLCRETSRVISFNRINVRAEVGANVIERYVLGSQCPSKQMPKNRLETGNYEFKDLPIRANEEFLIIIQTNGLTTHREILNKSKNGFFTPLGEGQVLTIIISERLECNCAAN